MELQRRLPWNLIVIWAVTATLAVLSCSLILEAAYWRGEYLPMGIDSFYHARRILDAVRDPSAFYEFDPLIHVPEGSLVPWPWGYDYAMAILVRLGMALGLSDNPMAILVWIPTLTAPISVALLIAIARQVGLSTALTALAASCLAVSTSLQTLHGVGFIDHHYAELMFILGTLATGLAWLRKPESACRAAAIGVVLGLAPAVQNGLFIIQLPLLVTLFVLWLQGKTVPRRSALVFMAALLLATLAIVLPSQPFRMGHFEFYTLSWFHLYIAVCSSLTVIMLSRLQAARAGVISLLVLSALLIVPILQEIVIARGFITGSSEHLQMISEMLSLRRLISLYGMEWVGGFYSHLIWLLPATALVCVLKLYQERDNPRLLFWITSLIGLALLASQARMHYFGGFALFLPWLILLQQFCDKHPQHVKNSVLLASMGLLLAFYPQLRKKFLPTNTAYDVSFRNTRPVLAVLAKACAEDPGLVLADSDVGHYIRYYTQCSVIGNNFLLTPLHFRKVDEIKDLFGLHASEFVAKAPQVKYVLLRPNGLSPGEDGGVGYDFLQNNPQLYIDLLLKPQGEVPPEFVLLDQVRLPDLNNMMYSKLYKVRHDAPPAPVSHELSSSVAGK